MCLTCRAQAHSSLCHIIQNKTRQARNVSHFLFLIVPLWKKNKTEFCPSSRKGKKIFDYGQVLFQKTHADISWYCLPFHSFCDLLLWGGLVRARVQRERVTLELTHFLFFQAAGITLVGRLTSSPVNNPSRKLILSISSNWVITVINAKCGRNTTRTVLCSSSVTTALA